MIRCINAVEIDTRDQYFVGYGGLPNADGIMQLDAAIMNHHSQYGAVMGLENIKTPISVARKILEKCPHNILIGEGNKISCIIIIDRYFLNTNKII